MSTTEMKSRANEIMKDSLDKNYNVDCREECAYITNGEKTLYLDWSIPTDGLIIDIWFN